MVRNQGKVKAKQKRKRERKKERKRSEVWGTVVEKRGRKIIAFD